MEDIKKKYRKAKEVVEKTEEALDKIVLELKVMIKKQFWEVKGYPKYSTQNSVIIEEGIDFGIDAMRKQKTPEGR